MLTTTPPRLALLLVVFLVWTPAAYAWSWPVQGPVLQPFSYDAAHPYAAGQHRGVDIGAGSAGETVVAPAAGTVSFAGTVPTSGRSVTIQTSDGYSVTLTHLGSFLVAKGEAVAERDPIGTIGPSGTAEVEGPYVHLGIRTTSDPNGYLDPLGFLPPVATDGGTDGSTSSQPGSGSGSSTDSGGAPASSAGSSSTTATEPGRSKARDADVSESHTRSSDSGEERERVQHPRSEARPERSSRRPAVPRGDQSARTSRPAATERRAEVTTSSFRRPVVEPAAPAEPTGLDAGHERPTGAPVEPLPSTSRRRIPTALLPLVLNGAAALFALGAALVTANTRRRRCSETKPGPAAQVLHLPQRAVEGRRASRAA